MKQLKQINLFYLLGNFGVHMVNIFRVYFKYIVSFLWMVSDLFKILQLLDSKTLAIASKHIVGHQTSLGDIDFSTLFSVPILYLAPERPY